MSEYTLPVGALIKVEVEIRLPVAATEKQIDQWLDYGMFQGGGIDTDNPLLHEHPEPFRPTSLMWNYGGFLGKREEYDYKDTPSGREWRVRYIRERAPSASIEPLPAGLPATTKTTSP